MSFPSNIAQRSWHLIDASNQVVGRLATQIAPLLKGKHKPTFRPNADCGDNVVVINAEKVKFTGKKLHQKLYHWHTNYPGGLRSRRAGDQLARQPTKVLRSAVLGMLTKNKLRHSYMEKRLHIYPGGEHPFGEEVGEVMLPRVPSPGRRGDFHFGLKELGFNSVKK